jgi:hypothetical protein
MSWKRIIMLRGGEDQIREAFTHILQRAYARSVQAGIDWSHNEAKMYERGLPGGHTEFFFTPEAALLADQLLVSHQAQNCSEPSLSDLAVSVQLSVGS